MIDKTRLLDPTSTADRSEYEQEVIEDAQSAGKSLESTDPTSGDPHLRAPRETGGTIEQTVSSKAVAGFGKPGDESDLSPGEVDSDENTEAGRTKTGDEVGDHNGT